MNDKYKSVMMRFVKAFIAGSLSTAGLITVGEVETWTQLVTALQGISLAMLIGGINGILMAGEKLINWKE